MPRIAPITTKAELPVDQQAIADAVLSVFGHIRGPFSMLLHSPSLAERLLPMVKFVREDTIVEPNLRFAAILTAAREIEAPYVWAAQVALARKKGIRDELIDLIRTQGETDELPEDERQIIMYVRQLMSTHRIDQAIFDALKKRHDAKWLVELTAIANFFAFVSGICNAFDVPPPPGSVEQRSAERVVVTRKGTLRVGNKSAPCEVQNMCPRGFLIKASEELPVGRVAHLRCELYPSRFVSCTVQIRHVNRGSLGAKVIEIGEEDRQMCEQFVEEQRVRRLSTIA